MTKPLFKWRNAICSEDGPESPITRLVLLALRAIEIKRKALVENGHDDTLDEKTLELFQEKEILTVRIANLKTQIEKLGNQDASSKLKAYPAAKREFDERRAVAEGELAAAISKVEQLSSVLGFRQFTPAIKEIFYPLLGIGVEPALAHLRELMEQKNRITLPIENFRESASELFKTSHLGDYQFRNIILLVFFRSN